jgi:chitinase
MVGCPSTAPPNSELDPFACEIVISATGSPIANADSSQIVEEGATVVLDGSASMQVDGSNPLQFAWTQTGGVAVELAGADTATASWTAPNVASLALFTFSLTVSDEVGDSCPAEVIVTVTDAAAGQ